MKLDKRFILVLVSSLIPFFGFYAVHLAYMLPPFIDSIIGESVVNLTPLAFLKQDNVLMIVTITSILTALYMAIKQYMFNKNTS